MSRGCCDLEDVAVVAGDSLALEDFGSFVELLLQGFSGSPGGIPDARWLQAALNGDRVHPAAPRTPDQIAAQARAAVDAGARSVHLHPYDQHGQQTFAAEPCAVTLRAVRAACPGIPISLSTSADVEPDPRRRIELVEAWSDLPDLVTANQGEHGIDELCELLLSRGIGIEAGLLSMTPSSSSLRVWPRIASAPWSNPSTPIRTRPSPTLGRSNKLWTRQESSSSKSITATASPPGRSTFVLSLAGTASGPAWKTPQCYSTAAPRKATAIWSPRRQPCSRTTRPRRNRGALTRRLRAVRRCGQMCSVARRALKPNSTVAVAASRLRRTRRRAQNRRARCSDSVKPSR